MRKRIRMEDVSPKAFYDYCNYIMSDLNIPIDQFLTFEKWVKPADEYPHYNRTRVIKDGSILTVDQSSYNTYLYHEDHYIFDLTFDFTIGHHGYGALYYNDFKEEEE